MHQISIYKIYNVYFILHASNFVEMSLFSYYQCIKQKKRLQLDFCQSQIVKLLFEPTQNKKKNGRKILITTMAFKQVDVSIKKNGEAQRKCQNEHVLMYAVHFLSIFFANNFDKDMKM
jgi:hypothetical protein